MELASGATCAAVGGTWTRALTLDLSVVAREAQKENEPATILPGGRLPTETGRPNGRASLRRSGAGRPYPSGNMCR